MPAGPGLSSRAALLGFPSSGLMQCFSKLSKSECRPPRLGTKPTRSPAGLCPGFVGIFKTLHKSSVRPPMTKTVTITMIIVADFTTARLPLTSGKSEAAA
eukprot:scaffold8449_cov277-Pinguiococcus_pyrenoidosus.AAC.4